VLLRTWRSGVGHSPQRTRPAFHACAWPARTRRSAWHADMPRKTETPAMEAVHASG
jgi:hypothetical protein